MSLVRHKVTVGIACAFAGLLVLTSCAQPPDPKETRQSLEHLQKKGHEDKLSKTEEKYNAEAHPEPIVEPEECSAVTIITVRGTNEPNRAQLVGPVARQIARATEDRAPITNLDYPATSEMEKSGTEGVRKLIDTLNVQSKHCPSEKFVLLGYSQGAMVIGDALDDSDQRSVGRGTGKVDDNAVSAISAIVLYGDPRFRGSAPSNVGDFDAEANGLVPRKEGALQQFAGRMQSFCVSSDFICQGGEFNETGHVEYFKNGMQDEGAKFAIKMLSEQGLASEKPPEDDEDKDTKDDSASGGESTDDDAR
jgi:hypothetical protein